MSQGWIKLHRILLKKPVWHRSTPEQKTILITLLLMVWHKEQEWVWMGQKFKTEPGQIVTSIEGIMECAGKGITKQNVRTALVKFENLQFLTNQSTKTGRLITIVNWGLYQGGEDEANIDTNIDLTDNQPTPNRQVTPNNNVNNDKNAKNEKKTYTSDFETFWNFYPRRIEKQKAFKCWNTLLTKKHLPDEMITAATNYAAFTQKKGTEINFIKHPATFLGPNKPFLEWINPSPELTQQAIPKAYSSLQAWLEKED